MDTLLPIIFALFTLIDVIPFIKRRFIRGILVHMTFFVSALMISILWHVGVEVPSVMGMISDALKSVGLSYR